jgi:hypothetical protein
MALQERGSMHSRWNDWPVSRFDAGKSLEVGEQKTTSTEAESDKRIILAKKLIVKPHRKKWACD